MEEGPAGFLPSSSLSVVWILRWGSNNGGWLNPGGGCRVCEGCHELTVG